MSISYKINVPVVVGQFQDLLRQSGLDNRRPVDDPVCLGGMLKNANLLVTSWDSERLIGLARSITDFHYACYLSDLAVDRDYQGRGIGTELQRVTQAQLGARCKLILVAAPDADAYYQHIGYTRNSRCWILGRQELLKSRLGGGV